MVPEKNRVTVENAADDLLLLVERAAADLPANTEDVIAGRMGDVFAPQVTDWIAKHKSQAKGATAAAGIVSEAASEFATAYFRLALRVIVRTAGRIGETPAELLAAAHVGDDPASQED